jgi:hypothetical protein
VFTGSGTVWNEQGMLTGAGETGEMFGASVALSAGGETALVGAPRNEARAGAAWLYERAGTTWGAAQKRLRPSTPSNTSEYKLFGTGVALSANAVTRLVSGHNIRGFGGAWVFGPNPAVESVTPDDGPAAGGTTVTIAGEHFEEASAVRFGANAATSFTVNSNKSITAVAPAGSGTVAVVVETPIGASAETSADAFTYVAPGGEEGGFSTTGTSTTSTTSSSGTSSPAASVQVLSFGPLVGGGCRAVLLANKLAVLGSHRAVLKLRVSGVGICKGTLTLREQVRLSKKRTKIETLGSASFSGAAGKLVTVKVKLTSAGVALLRSHRGRLLASLVIKKSSPAPIQARTVRVRLAQVKPAKKKP